MKRESAVSSENSLTQFQFEQERFKRVIEASNTGIWEWNIKTNQVYYSPRWKEMLGYKDEELPNEFSTWQESLHPEDLDRMLKNVNDFVQNPDGHFEHEFRMKHKNGNYVWILNRSAVSFDENGLPEYMSGSHLDITERVQNDEKLKSSEMRFRSVFEHSPLGKSITELDGTLHVNKRFEEITGYTRLQLQNMNWKDITHPEDIEDSEKAIHQMMASSEPVNFRKRYLHKNGSIIWTDVRSVAHRDANGEIRHFFTTIADITENVKAEEQLLKSEERFRLLFKSLPIPLCNVDSNDNLVLVNDYFIKTFGYTLEDVPTLDEWWKKAYPDDEYRAWVLKNWSEAIEKAQTESVEIRSDEYIINCKNGEKRTVIIGGITLTDGFLATFIDVTERTKAESELKIAKEYAETIIQTASAILVVLDNQGNVKSINKAGERITGYKFSELKGRLWFETLVPRKKYPEVWNEFERLSKGGVPETFENVILTKSGEEKIIQWQNSPLLNNDIVKGIVSFGTDVTQKKNTEQSLVFANQELLNSNKELEQFAYVASHDLQEPLRKVKNYTDLLQNRYKDVLDEKATKYMEVITNGVGRMQLLIDDLLMLSRVTSQGREFTVVDLNHVISEVVDILEIKIRDKNARVTFEHLPVVKGDQRQLVQLFQNLVSNALKYNNSEIPEIKIDAEKDGRFWNIKVTDNGIGFDMKFQDRIFVPFQRLHTRNEFSGSGIGLAVCKKIVSRHKGFIKVDSVPEKGSSFFIHLPYKK